MRSPSDFGLPAGKMQRAGRRTGAPVRAANDAGQIWDGRHEGDTTGRGGADRGVVDPLVTATVALEQALEQTRKTLRTAQGYSGTETLGSLRDRWLSYCANVHADTTTTKYRYAVNRVLAELGRPSCHPPEADTRAHRQWMTEQAAQRQLRDLTRADFELALDAMPRGWWINATCALSSMFTWGEERGYTGCSSIAPALRKRKPTARRFGPTVWIAAVRALVCELRDADERGRPVAGAALLSVSRSIRRRAAAMLPWSGVDLDERIISVVDKGRHREVAMSAIDVALLSQIPRVGSFVFPGVAGPHVHVHPDSLTKAARRAFDFYGGLVLRGVTLHQAGRHAPGFLSRDLGATYEQIADTLGHSSTDVTKLYVPPSTDPRGRELLDEALISALSGVDLGMRRLA